MLQKVFLSISCRTTRLYYLNRRPDAFASSSACSGGIAEGTSGIADEVPDGSLPDAFGRPVDHGGGGRHLERAEQIEALREQQKKLRH